MNLYEEIEKEAIIMKKFFAHLEELLEAYYKTFA